MAPRRSGRRSVSAYKKGDYVEYQYKGSTVTGKLLKKSPASTATHPIWVLTPTDRRRKNEDIPEKALGKIIGAEEAMNNRGPKLKRTSSRVSAHTESPSPASSNSNSDGSFDQPQAPKRRGGRGSPSEDVSKTGGSAVRKRKGDETSNSGCSERENKSQKTVTFFQEPAAAAAFSKRNIMKKSRKKTRKGASTRIGTRSMSGPGETMVLLPDFPRKSAFHPKKKIKKDENVTVVKMLTGTLYLYRGDRPRAEFVRSK